MKKLTPRHFRALAALGVFGAYVTTEASVKAAPPTNPHYNGDYCAGDAAATLAAEVLYLARSANEALNPNSRQVFLNGASQRVEEAVTLGHKSGVTLQLDAKTGQLNVIESRTVQGVAFQSGFSDGQTDIAAYNKMSGKIPGGSYTDFLTVANGFLATRTAKACSQ